MKSFLTCMLYADQIRENEMGRECSMQGRDDKCFQNLGWET